MRRQVKTGGASSGAAAITEVEDRFRQAETTADATPVPAQRAGEDLVVDGKKIVITAATEIELRCGDAFIRLTRDGKVIIRGTNVSSRATAQNRIRGGSVHIN
jgi:hypothetical protein